MKRDGLTLPQRLIKFARDIWMVLGIAVARFVALERVINFSALSAMICVRPLPLRDCLCGSRLHGRERRRCGRQAQDPTRSRQTPRSEERLRPLASPMGGRARFWLAVSI